MAPRRRKQKNHDNIPALQILQLLIRRYCCWNCFQMGHNRHQCPFPRIISCSYCRKPGVLSQQCNCDFSKLNSSHYRNCRNVETTSSMELVRHENLVSVPNPENNDVPVLQENLLISISNNNDEPTTEQDPTESEQEDLLEIHAEDEPLDEL